MKPLFKISNISFTSENQTSGRKETLNFEGIEIQCDITLQEMLQLHKDGAVAGDRILRFFRGELPDMIRNCGNAILEVREKELRQKIKYEEMKKMAKKIFKNAKVNAETIREAKVKAEEEFRKAERKAEEQKEQEQPYKVVINQRAGRA